MEVLALPPMEERDLAAGEAAMAAAGWRLREREESLRRRLGCWSSETAAGVERGRDCLDDCKRVVLFWMVWTIELMVGVVKEGKKKRGKGKSERREREISKKK